MKLDKHTMMLYAVTDRAWVGKQTLYEQVELALKGGVTCVQLREKDNEYKNILTEAKEISSLCKKYNVPILINDDVHLAVNCGADGVHVGQGDMSIEDVRAIVGDNMLIGVSVHTVSEAICAVNGGANYLGVGALFSTSTKIDASTVSKQTLKDICSAVDIPVVAIGGITKQNMMELSETSVDGVALVSAIFGVDDIEKECRELYAISEKMVNNKN